MNTKTEKLRDACELAAQTFRKLSTSEYEAIISKLEFCIGSYNFDKNPSGLYEFGYQALNMLKDVKQKNPRKVNKNVLTSLEQGLSS
jgi:hypothetical protein